jgi:hypothetical protein
MAEFTAAGVIIPNFFMRTFRKDLYLSLSIYNNILHLRYVDSVDRFRGFLEVVFCLFVAYYIYTYIREVSQECIEYSYRKCRPMLTIKIMEVSNSIYLTFGI